MDRHRRRRAGKSGTQGTPPRGQLLAVIPPPLLSVPATAAAARRRGPTQDQLFACVWNCPLQNHDEAVQARGHKGFPLPANAPAVEGLFFKYSKSDKTNLEALDVQMKSLYDDNCNGIGDKRREMLHYLDRSPRTDDEGLNRLRQELSVLMVNAYKKIKEILDTTGYVAYLPHYFSHAPKLK